MKKRGSCHKSPGKFPSTTSALRKRFNSDEGGGGGRREISAFTFCGMKPELRWDLPIPMRIHICGQEVAMEPRLLPDREGSFLASCLNYQLRWPCCYQSLDCSQSAKLKFLCFSLIPLRIITSPKVYTMI